MSKRKRKARVLILIENQAYAVDRRVTAEAQALLADGYRVSVISPVAPDRYAQDGLDDVLVRSFRPRHASGGKGSQVIEYLVALGNTLRLMIGLARSPGFDVIQACNPPDLFFLISWPFKLAGKRFVFDQHDLTPELYSALFATDGGPIMAALRWSERMSYRLADVVLACNESFREVALSRGGVSPDRVFVVRNGPRGDWPLPVAPDPSLRRGRRLLVVYMGIMGHQDGVDVLLDVIHTLVDARGFHDATFALVGDGNAAADLKRRARELGVEDYVDFAGWVTDDELLSQYLVTADACVCPEPSNPLNDRSTFVKVMEYVASGTPMVAFDLPETRVSAGDAAVYAAPGDIEGFAGCLLEVLTDPGLRAAMAAEAARRAPALRWERQAPNLIAAYERALMGGRVAREFGEEAVTRGGAT